MYIQKLIMNQRNNIWKVHFFNMKNRYYKWMRRFWFWKIVTHCVAHTVNGALRRRSLRSQRFKSSNCVGNSVRISEATSVVRTVRSLAVGPAKKLGGPYGSTIGGRRGSFVIRGGHIFSIFWWGVHATIQGKMRLKKYRNIYDSWKISR